MFKKIFIALSMLTVAMTAVAEKTPYVGFNLGVNDSHVSFNDSLSNRIDLGGRGALAGIFAGLGATAYQNFYLAGEIFANATGTNQRADVSLNNGMTVLRIRQKYSYGISFIPGALITERTMGYGRIGLVNTGFSAKWTDSTGNNSYNKTATGGQLGLGLQTSLTDNLDLRGEYDYTLYRSINFKNGVRSSPNTDQFNIALVYKFGDE